ncbi:MAG: hypothetical protein ABW168_17025 [Sedimenticola sp.]
MTTVNYISAMVHAGIGEKHLNALLTTLGVPHINAKTLKRRERDIGPFIEKTAKESCLESSYAEKALMLSHADDTTATVSSGHSCYTTDDRIPDMRGDNSRLHTTAGTCSLTELGSEG